MPRKVSLKVERLLNRVIKRMKADPRRVDMDMWGYRPTKRHTFGLKPSEMPACGTAGCIAGWIALDAYSAESIVKMTRGRFEKLMDSASLSSAKTLGLEYGEADELFMVDLWPLKYGYAYEAARTPRQRANATISRIKHFIRTGA